MSGASVGTVKTLVIVAGAVGTFVGGLIVGVRGGSEAKAQVPSSIEHRLQSIDLTLQDMRRDLSTQQTDVRVIKCYLHLEQICPPYPAEVRP